MFVDHAFFDHFKTAQLTEALKGDPVAPLYVLRLWAHCEARKAWTFDLSAQSLKALCRFTGDPRQLDTAMTASGFVRREDQKLIVHQWEEYNRDLVAKWPKPKPTPPPKAVKGKYSAAFEAWWGIWPKKVAKDKANAAYVVAGNRVKIERNLESGAAAAYLLEAATAYAASDEGQSQYCPHPATWLNAGRWADDRKQWNRPAESEKPKKQPKQLKLGDLDDVD